VIVSCTGASVSHTVINGRLLMKDKKLIGIDEDALMKQAQAVYERFLSFHQEYDRYNRPPHIYFPPSYRYMD
jgi:hypothetical protein